MDFIQRIYFEKDNFVLSTEFIFEKEDFRVEKIKKLSRKNSFVKKAKSYEIENVSKDDKVFISVVSNISEKTKSSKEIKLLPKKEGYKISFPFNLNFNTLVKRNLLLESDKIFVFIEKNLVDKIEHVYLENSKLELIDIEFSEDDENFLLKLDTKALFMQKNKGNKNIVVIRELL
jgi:hypothetical protein